MTEPSPGKARSPVDNRALLAELLRKRRAQAGGLATIPKRTASATCPLSFSQQRLCFLNQLESGNSAYNVYRAVRISGSLDTGALEKSLNEIVRRHEVLRATFPLYDGQPQQVIAPARTVKLDVRDLSDLASSEREPTILQLANEEAYHSFDLAQDFLLRTTLLRLGPQENVFLLTTHHIVADGWSVAILFTELGTLYEAFCQGQASPLPELPVQFGDFAAWQQQWLESADFHKQLHYWKQQLTGAPPALDLLTDRPRHARQSFRGARHFLVFPRPLLDGLTALSRREGVTLYMTLLAAFNAFLCALTGQEDILVGTPIAGRSRPELEGIIGCISNTLVMRTRLTGNPTFLELLGRVREAALGAFAHPEVPFESLVQELRPRRVPYRTPLFQVNFRLLTTPPPPLKLSGLELRFLEIDNQMAKFDLAFELAARPEGLGGYVEYFAELFDAATISRMVEQFEQLLESIVARPDARLTDLLNPLRVRQPLPPVSEPGKAPSIGKSFEAVSRKAVELPAQALDSPPSHKAEAVPGTNSERKQPYALRKATMRDCKFLYLLRKLVLRKYVEQFPDWTGAQRDAYYLDFDPSVHEIIVVDGKEVGDIALVKSETEFNLLSLHLRPEYQNQGIGAMLMRDALAEADACCLPFVLRVLKTNPAIHFYERLGFVITEEKDLRYVMKRPARAPRT